MSSISMTRDGLRLHWVGCLSVLANEMWLILRGLMIILINKLDAERELVMDQGRGGVGADWPMASLVNKSNYFYVT
jgi:hypothetical protein